MYNKTCVFASAYEIISFLDFDLVMVLDFINPNINTDMLEIMCMI